MVHQFYQSRVSDEFVLRGNAGILKCLIPSFVTDFIEVDAWVSNDGETFVENNSDLGKKFNWNRKFTNPGIPFFFLSFLLF